MATNNAINVATAATGKVLRAQGIGIAPVFSTATYPDTAGTSGNVLTSDGTNFLSQPPVLQVLKSAAIDMKSATAQLLFTSPVGNFVTVAMVNYSTSLTGAVTPGNFNIGWTATNYDDFLLGSNTQIADNNTYAITTVFGGATGTGTPPFPSATNIFINVTGAAVATTDTEVFYFIGYLLF